jgi:hypothetical protein
LGNNAATLIHLTQPRSSTTRIKQLGKTELQELRREVEAWWKQSPFKELDFAPATYVWRNWVETQGPLRTLLPVSLPDTGDLAGIKRCIKQWSDERQIRRVINHTDRELIGRSAGQKGY